MGAPALPLDIDTVLVALSVVSYAVQGAGWLWVRRLGRQMAGGDGAHLVSIVAFLLGWSLVLRAVTLFALIYYDMTDDPDLVVVLSISSQLLFLFLVYEVWRRLRRFRDG